MPLRYLIVAVLLATVSLGIALALADASGDPAPVRNDDGKYYDKAGNPTYRVQPDGTTDWFTYSGYRRYHADCHVCHGPDGEGSSYGPALINSLKKVDYAEYSAVVVNGRKNVNTAQ